MPYVLIVLSVLLVGVSTYTLNIHIKLSSTERANERITRYWDAKSGGTALLTGEIINYNLRSFDGGRHWYAVEHDKDHRMRILGDAESIYPGLLEHLDAMQALTDQVSHHGPLQLTSIESEGAQLLRRAGFTVENSK